MEGEATNATSPVGGESSTQAAPAPEAPGPQGGSNPKPVPYAVFKATNDQLATLKAQHEAVQAELGQYGKARVEQLQQELAQTRAEGDLRLELASSGVQRTYLDYLTSRYNELPGEGRPPAAEWAAQLQASEPAFFGASASAANQSTPAPEAPNPTPKTSPDAAASSQTPPGSQIDPPITDEYLRGIGQEEFNRRYEEIAAYMRQRRTVGR